jgi:hypothetical protein
MSTLVMSAKFHQKDRSYRLRNTSLHHLFFFFGGGGGYFTTPDFKASSGGITDEEWLGNNLE